MISRLAYIGVLTVLLQGSISPVIAQPDNRGSRSPLIATGWDSPNPRQFREGLATFESWGVFDGTTLRATRQTADSAEAAAIFAFSDEMAASRLAEVSPSPSPRRWQPGHRGYRLSKSAPAMA